MYLLYCMFNSGILLCWHSMPLRNRVKSCAFAQIFWAFQIKISNTKGTGFCYPTQWYKLLAALLCFSLHMKIPFNLINTSSKCMQYIVACQAHRALVKIGPMLVLSFSLKGLTHLGHCKTHLGHCATYLGHYAIHLGHCATHFGHWATYIMSSLQSHGSIRNRTIMCQNQFCWGLMKERKK